MKTVRFPRTFAGALVCAALSSACSITPSRVVPLRGAVGSDAAPATLAIVPPVILDPAVQSKQLPLEIDFIRRALVGRGYSVIDAAPTRSILERGRRVRAAQGLAPGIESAAKDVGADAFLVLVVERFTPDYRGARLRSVDYAWIYRLLDGTTGRELWGMPAQGAWVRPGDSSVQGAPRNPTMPTMAADEVEPSPWGASGVWLFEEGQPIRPFDRLDEFVRAVHRAALSKLPMR